MMTLKTPLAPPGTWGFDNIAPGGSRPVLLVYGARAYDACADPALRLFPYAIAALPAAWPAERDAELAPHLRRLAGRPVILWAEDGDDGRTRALRHAGLVAAAGARAVGLIHPNAQPGSVPPAQLAAAGLPALIAAALRHAELRALPAQGRRAGRAVPPHAGAVDPPRLLDAMRALVQRHVAVEDDAALLVALWCLHAWRAGDFTLSPRLVLKATDARADHAKALRLIAWLTPKPLLIARAFAAHVLPALESGPPTLLLDDVAGGLLYRRDMRTLLTAGAHADAVFMTGMRRAKAVACAAPAAIATAAAPPDDLAARAIVLPMAPPSRARPPVVYDNPPDEVIGLRAAIHAHMRRVERPAPAATARDTWAPLLAVARGIDDATAHDAYEALRRVTKAAPAPASNLSLLADIAALFAIEENVRIPTAQLIERLTADPELPWAAIRRGAKLSPRDLAERLAPFGVKAQSLRLADGAVVRGYRGADLKDAVARYLPGHVADDEDVAACSRSCSGIFGGTPPL